MDHRDKILTRAARITAVALHPLAVTLYGALALLFCNTVLYNLPVALKFYYLALVALTTCIVPLLSLALVGSMNFTEGWRGRWKQAVPLALVVVCYGFCAYMLSDAPLVFLVRKLLLAAVGCAVAAMAASLFTEVSLGMVAWGGLAGVLAIVDFSGFGRLAGVLCAAILLAGLLGSSLLLTGKNNLQQVAAGFFGGLLVAVAILLI